jgi:hypothetical protein
MIEGDGRPPQKKTSKLLMAVMVRSRVGGRE